MAIYSTKRSSTRKLITKRDRELITKEVLN